MAEKTQPGEKKMFDQLPRGKYTLVDKDGNAAEIEIDGSLRVTSYGGTEILNRSIQEYILVQLEIMNKHLEIITDNVIKEKDLI